MTNNKGASQNYYVGKEYIEDKDKIDVLIKYKFRSPVVFESINFDYENLHIRQLKNGEIMCNLEKTISLKLFNIFKDQTVDLIAKHINDHNFIIGYIRKTLPIINNKLLKEKYLEGHILACPISINDLIDVAILDKNNLKSGGMIIWPIPIKGFPRSRLPKEHDAIFIRDLIDAMTLYFNFDYDGCIRKIITSLENYFIHFKLKIPSSGKIKIFFPFLYYKKAKFKKTIIYFLIEKYYPYKKRNLDILRENILFVYKLRNLITHDKLRISLTNGSICKKAIGTLLYIYQSSFVPKGQADYIFSFYAQFLIIDSQYNGINLDEIETFSSNNDNDISSKVISNKDEMDNFMFDGLEIKLSEKNGVLSL